MKEKPFSHLIAIESINFFRFKSEDSNNRPFRVQIVINDILIKDIIAMSSTTLFSGNQRLDKMNFIFVLENGLTETVEYTFARAYSLERRKLIFSKVLENICIKVDKTIEEANENPHEGLVEGEDYQPEDKIIVKTIRTIDLNLELENIEKNFLENNWDITNVENISGQMYDIHNSKLRDIRKTHVSQLIGSEITISSNSLANIEVMDNPYWKETEWFKLAFSLHSGQILYMILDISDPNPSNIGYGHQEHIPKYRKFFGFDEKDVDEVQLKSTIQEIIRENLENKKVRSMGIFSLYWLFYNYAQDNNLLYERV